MLFLLCWVLNIPLYVRSRGSFVGLLQLADIELDHLHHGLHHALRFAGSLSFIMRSRASGTICQETPNLSLSQPHCTGLPPSAVSASQSRSTSAWSLQVTDREIASLN